MSAAGQEKVKKLTRLLGMCCPQFKGSVCKEEFVRKCTGGSIREDVHLRSIKKSVKDDLEVAQLGQDNELDVHALISRGSRTLSTLSQFSEPLFLLCKIRIITVLTSKVRGGD